MHGIIGFTPHQRGAATFLDYFAALERVGDGDFLSCLRRRSRLARFSLGDIITRDFSLFDGITPTIPFPRPRRY